MAPLTSGKGSLMDFNGDGNGGNGAVAADGDDRKGASEMNRVVHSTGDIYERRTLLESAANVKSYLGLRRDRHERRARLRQLSARSTPRSQQPPKNETQNHSNGREVDRGDGAQSSAKSPPACTQKNTVNVLQMRRQRQRALLRVSARAFEERKKKVASPPPIPEETYATGLEITESSHRPVLPKGGGHEEDAFHEFSTSHSGESCNGRSESAGTAESTTWHHWQTCGANQSIFVGENEERKRRFEDAYRAIMLATNTNIENDEVNVSARWLETGGKRWTRDPNLPPAVSIDGRLYYDLQRDSTISVKQTYRMDDPNNAELFDRAATWMAHIPTPMNTRRSYAIERNNSIAEAILGQGIERAKTPHEALHNAYRDKQNGFESMVRGVANLDLTQDLQTTALSSSTRKRQSMDKTINLGEDDKVHSFNRGKSKEREKTEVIIGHGTENSTIQHRAKSDTKPTSPNRSAVGISTLRRLFSRVPSETKKPEPPIESRFKNRTELTTPFQPPEPHRANRNTTKMSDPFVDSCYKNHGATKALPQQHEPKHTSPDTDDKMSNRSEPKRKIQNTTTIESNEMDERILYKYKKGLGNSIAAASGASIYLDKMNLLEIDASKMKPPNSLNDILAKENKEVDSSCENEAFADPTSEGHDDLHNDIRDRLDVTNLVKESLLTRQVESSIIDTDGAESEVDGHYNIHSMLMSPSLITKRYQQALNAIEGRNWTQLSYLINANPWLMEMKDVRNDQSLVHSLSLFGGGSPENSSLPQHLAQNVIANEPSVVHKLDIEGNLPLHMAAASGNIIMIEELGCRFSGGASVQNHNGLLPLHLAIMSCDLFPTGIESVELILMMFPGAVGVKDVDGNTPLHTAAGMLREDVGAYVINLLVDGCYTLMLEKGYFFDRSARHSAPIDNEEPIGMNPGDLEAIPDFYLLKNNQGETPLIRAIKSLAGGEVVEALLNGGCGQLALLDTNSASQNAFHLALDSKFHDAAVVLSILKSTPSIATIRDGKGKLPIHLACVNSSQHEIVLAIAIIDLPIDLGAKEGTTARNGFGASWWYLLCESNDLYVNVVKEILSLCSRPQIIALCLTKEGSRHGGWTAVTCATPLCKAELRRSLLFFGRFELGRGENNNHDHTQHSHSFDAIDFGIEEDPLREGKKVSLFCYTNANEYIKDSGHLQHCTLDKGLFEELSHFAVSEEEADVTCDLPILRCIAVDRPAMSLAHVAAAMPNHHRYRSNLSVLGRYFGKSRAILRQVAKALNQLHRENIIHGLVDLDHIGKMGEGWKITGLPGSVVIGNHFATCRMGLHSPPEAFILAQNKISHEPNLASLAPSLKAEATVDIWAFGKLMYEVFAGESLFMIFLEEVQNRNASECILAWSDAHLREVSIKLLEDRIGSSGVDLVLGCLSPKRSTRTKSMVDILHHPFWRDEKAFRLR